MTMNKWISVKEQLPEKLKDVLFYYYITGMNNQKIKEDIVCGHLDDEGWNICYLFISMPINDKVIVTHWMELAEFPIENE